MTAQALRPSPQRAQRSGRKIDPSSHRTKERGTPGPPLWRARIFVSDVLVSALPEFLGSLSAGLVIAAITWTVRRVRARRARTSEPSASAGRSSSRTHTG